MHGPSLAARGDAAPTTGMRSQHGSQKKRIPRNMGRIEFIACRDAIDALHEQGVRLQKNPYRPGPEGQSHHVLCDVLLSHDPFSQGDQGAS